MQPMYYIGLDVHKRKISYCEKDGSGQIQAEGSEVWFYLGTTAERPTHAAKNHQELTPALLRSASGEPLPS